MLLKEARDIVVGICFIRYLEIVVNSKHAFILALGGRKWHKNGHNTNYNYISRRKVPRSHF